MATELARPIGLVLGSGAARGWAHVGAIRALGDAGIVPDLVCGSSAGSLVGGLYAAGQLDALEGWGRQLDFRQVVGYFDLAFRGGLIRGRKLFEELGARLPVTRIEELERPFAAVATDLESGREVWLREGSLVEGIRASMALPGLLTPVKIDGRWLIDGGVLNPVPVSLCRAMGARTVIAVDLNTTLLGRRTFDRGSEAKKKEPWPVATAKPGQQPDRPGGFRATFDGLLAEVRQRMGSAEPVERDPLPSLYEVIASSINIMQDRIGRGRMAGDPPDLLVAPQLAGFGLLDFDRADEAIAEGRVAVERTLVAASLPQRA